MTSLHAQAFEGEGEMVQRAPQHQIYGGGMSDGGEKRPGDVVAMGAKGNIMGNLHCIVFSRRRCWSRPEKDEGNDRERTKTRTRRKQKVDVARALALAGALPHLDRGGAKHESR